jgi:GxxExxY protein
MLKHESLSKIIIETYYEVYNELGYGFLEKVYENSFIIALQEKNIHGRRQVPIKVHFRNNNVGNYFADIIVEDIIIIELKAADSLCLEHETQLMNYLKATDIELGFLFNFGLKPEFKRKIFENEYKKPVLTSSTR